MGCININLTVNPFIFNIDRICKLLYMIVTHYQNKTLCNVVLLMFSRIYRTHPKVIKKNCAVTTSLTHARQLGSVSESPCVCPCHLFRLLPSVFTRIVNRSNVRILRFGKSYVCHLCWRHFSMSSVYLAFFLS